MNVLLSGTYGLIYIKIKTLYQSQQGKHGVNALTNLVKW
tara:strand:- start:33 stop:149 length:117 start_codon:yes stop_codon:yes gene_type:complete